jgi:large subunit ribosomal protein L40e
MYKYLIIWNFICVCEEMQIYVQKLTGNVIKLKLNESDSIKTLKCKVNEKRQIPPDQQTLLFKGKKLEDNLTLSDYKIT